MRIDEFSKPSDIDGSFSTAEQTRFLLFGFDISLDDVATFFESLSFNSLITISISFASLMTITDSFDSLVTTGLDFDSPLEDD